jgi:hypothetical protein
MAFYLKGIGDAGTRENEILPSFDARINKFLLGHAAGLIKGEFGEFACAAIDRGVIVRNGMAQAYGYFGMSDTEIQINFVMPSVQSYVHVYAEVDLAVVPNKFQIKTTEMSNASAHTFQQDNLTQTQNGRYQFPLWLVTLTATSIALTDRRTFISKPLQAVNAEISVTAAQTDRSTKIATTAYVREAIDDVKNITEDSIAGASGFTVYGKIRRQVDFVICSFSFESEKVLYGGEVIGTVPEGYRPKTAVTASFLGSFQYLFYAPYQGSMGNMSVTVYPDGRIINNVGGYMDSQKAWITNGGTVVCGYEITA